jgi:hypothetical protein
VIADLAGIDTICIEPTSTGLARAEAGRVEGALTLLGLEAGVEECPATLRIDLDAARFGTQYSGGQTCYTGYSYTGEIGLVLGGTQIDAWPIEVAEPPAQYLVGDSCPDEFAAIKDADQSWQRDLAPALLETFGPLGFAAALASFDIDDPLRVLIQSDGWDGGTALDVVSDERVPMFLAWLMGRSDLPHQADRALFEYAMNQPENPVLVPALPYLIAAADPDDFWDWPTLAIAIITGKCLPPPEPCMPDEEDRDLQAAWEWWEQNKPEDAGG